MKELKFISTLFIVVLVASCKKYKEPTDVDFFFDIKKESTINGQLNFTGGHMIIDFFEFTGDREKGDDVHFSQEFSGGQEINFDITQPVSALDFIIPQGDYKRIDIGFSTLSEETCLVIEGNYSYTSGGSIPFMFEIEDPVIFDIQAENPSGGNIILDKDVLRKAQIFLNPKHWFQPVPTSYFEDADLVDEEGTDYITVSKENNEEIYNLVFNRIGEAATVLFNY